MIFNWVRKISPAMPAIFGACGVVASVIFAAKDAVNAAESRADAEEVKGEPLTTAEAIEISAPHFVRTVLCCGATIGCIMASGVNNIKQREALIAASASIGMLYEQRHCDNALPNSRIGTPMRDTKSIFYTDEYPTFFERDFGDIQEAMYYLNKLLTLQGYVCLDDFFALLDLPPTSPRANHIGWERDSGKYESRCNWIDYCIKQRTLDDGLRVNEIVFNFLPHDLEHE